MSQMENKTIHGSLKGNACAHLNYQSLSPPPPTPTSSTIAMHGEKVQAVANGGTFVIIFMATFQTFQP